MKCYKVMRTTDGMFSNGGFFGGFSKTGKRWSTKGGLKAHLTVLDDHFKGVYKDCIIVEYDLRECNQHVIKNFI